ncbi:MAG: hypothetical protein JWP96_894 [Polaromonas sp.]|nr:hypothetical protein [Polaromonas sp.]
MKNIAILACAVFVAAGCGGGSDTSPAGTPAVTTGSASIEGAAVKGPLAKAKISFYKTSADGKQGDLLKETVSDDAGHYSITINGYSGVVIVVASAVSGTTMYDEATGQTIIPVAGFSLRASFSVESGKTYSAQINPFTELATATALAKTGGLTATNVDQAKTDLAATLTFNPLTTAATFNADKKPTNTAAGALAAVSQMALSGNLGCSTGDQAAKVVCVTTALSGKGLNDAAVKSALQTAINLVNDNFGLPALAITTPSGTPAPAATPLEQTKAFMSALRSNVKALDASDLSLETELQKVANDITGRTAPLANTSITAMNLARLGANLWGDVIKGSEPFAADWSFYKNNEYSTFSVPSQQPIFSSGYVGGCSFYSDTAYTNKALTQADAKYVACRTAPQTILATKANGEYKPCSAVGDWCATQWSYRVRLHPDAADVHKFTIYTQTQEALITITSLQPPTFNPTLTTYGAAFPGNAATLVTQHDSKGKITALSLTGEIAPAFSITRNATSYFDSALNRVVSKPNAVATVLGDKHNIGLSAVLSKVGELDKLAFSGSIELIKAGALETRLELAAGSYLQAKPDAAGNYEAQDGSQEMLLKLKGGTAGSTLAGDLKISAFKLDKSGANYIPTLVAFNGSVQRNGVAFFEGELKAEALNHASFNSSQPNSVTNVETQRVGFVAKVTIPNRPVLSVSLSATQNDSGSSATNTTALSGQYVQGPITINVSGASSAAANTVTLESTSGVKLLIDKSKSVYPLTKGGQPVGQYSTLTNRVTYTDNSYEQF